MTYDFYRKVARILAKENENALFDYITHAMDNNGGFLRTRYCYRDKELKNQQSNSEIKTVLLALRNPFDFCSSADYYSEKLVKDGTETVLKMQLFYYDLSDEKRFNDISKWSARVGYPYSIRIDMENETYEVYHLVSK